MHGQGVACCAGKFDHGQQALHLLQRDGWIDKGAEEW